MVNNAIVSLKDVIRTNWLLSYRNRPERIEYYTIYTVYLYCTLSKHVVYLMYREIDYILMFHDVFVFKNLFVSKLSIT